MNQLSSTGFGLSGTAPTSASPPGIAPHFRVGPVVRIVPGALVVVAVQVVGEQGEDLFILLGLTMALKPEADKIVEVPFAVFRNQYCDPLGAEVPELPQQQCALCVAQMLQGLSDNSQIRHHLRRQSGIRVGAVESQLPVFRFLAPPDLANLTGGLATAKQCLWLAGVDDGGQRLCRLADGHAVGLCWSMGRYYLVVDTVVSVAQATAYQNPGRKVMHQ